MKKKTSRQRSDDLRPEYDLAALGPGVRGKYAKQLEGTTFVALQPEVAAAFPTATAVNAALRAILMATAVVRRPTAVPKRSSRRPSRSNK